MFDYEGAERAIGYRFKDRTLLERAFTHASVANRTGVRSYDRLEFLGDSVLSLVATEYLYRHTTSDCDEGELSRIRSCAVDRNALARTFEKHGFAEFVIASGDVLNAQAKVPSDVTEAVFGAVFADAGWETARAAILNLHGEEIVSAASGDRPIDYKSALQEAVQACLHTARTPVEYRTEAETEAGVTVSVFAGGEKLASATAPSKRAAEKLAAECAYRAIQTKQNRGIKR